MRYAILVLEAKREAVKDFRHRAAEDAIPGVNHGELFAAQEDLTFAIDLLRAHSVETAKEEAKKVEADKKRRARRASSPPPADEPETKPQTPNAKERKRRGRPPKVRPEDASMPQDDLPLERRDTEAPPPSGSVSTFGEVDFAAPRAAHEQNGGAL